MGAPTDLPIAERRPLRSRSTPWANALSSALVRRNVTANAVSAGGLVAGLLAGASFAATSCWPALERPLLVAGAGFVQLRLLANLLDGMVALGGGRKSPTGPLWNELPDRLADVAILVGVGYAATGHPTLGWLAAVIAVGTAYVRAEVRASGAPNDFCGPMAKQHRMAVVTVAALSLAALPSGWRPALGSDGRHGLLSIALALIVVLGVVTIVRRVARAAKALRAKAR